MSAGPSRRCRAWCRLGPVGCREQRHPAARRARDPVRRRKRLRSVLTNLAFQGSRYGQLSIVGRGPEAVEALKKASALDPLSAYTAYFLGRTYISLGDYKAARATLEKATALAPQHVMARYWGFLELLEGKPAKALTTFQSHPTKWIQEFGTAVCEHTLGNEEASRKALADLLATQSDVAQYQIAEVYAWRGEADKAFEWLDRAYTNRDPGVCLVKADPFIVSLRLDPRYAVFLKKLKLPPPLD